MDEKNGPIPIIAGSTNPPPPSYQSQVPQPTVIIQPVLNQALILGKDPSHVIWFVHFALFPF